MLKINHVNYAYGKRQVLKDVCFEIHPGEITSIVGMNGSGKTTLMNLIMKLIPMQKGNITIDGKPITVNDFNRISYVPDQIIIPRNMTIQESLDFMERYYDCFNPQRAADLLDYFNLNRKDKIAILSKGNTAKMNILLGLCLDTDYIIMDEPFSGIDALARERILQVFTSQLVENRGVLIATHEIQEIENLIDKVVLLRDGEIIDQFSPEDKRYQEGKSILDVMREVY